MTIEKTTSNPVETRNYKAENAEIKRASQENNFIYSLMKKAENGSSNAIKKLLEYSMSNFNPDVEFAANLMQEAQEMLTKASEIYTNGAGKLSDLSLDTIKESILENDYNKLTDTEKQQKFNEEVCEIEQYL